MVLSHVLKDVVASNNVDLVPSDGWELIDTGVDEKAFEAGHPKSHHLLEGRDVEIFTIIKYLTILLPPSKELGGLEHFQV